MSKERNPVSEQYEDIFGGHNPEHDRRFAEDSPGGEAVSSTPEIIDHAYSYGGYEVGSGGPIACSICGKDVAEHASSCIERNNSQPVAETPVVSKWKARADREYCHFIEQMGRPESLGWEAKVESGQFGKEELSSHVSGGIHLGRHQAFAEVAASQPDGSPLLKELVDALELFVAILRRTRSSIFIDHQGLMNACNTADDVLAKAKKEIGQ